MLRRTALRQWLGEHLVSCWRLTRQYCYPKVLYLHADVICRQSGLICVGAGESRVCWRMDADDSARHREALSSRSAAKFAGTCLGPFAIASSGIAVRDANSQSWRAAL